ncbi:ATP-binding protein [Pelistega ratti]|uniref:ATP-binding protein n=1 Tax=Pelistega ratti TaxID=2652177 RepID=UPI00135A4ED7|nr:ATP-binding protein [Pelistega ratti]
MQKFWTLLTEYMTRHIRLGLFGRAFLVLFILLVSSLSAWTFAFLLAQQEPRATQTAERAITAYHITLKSLQYAPIEKHAALVVDLASLGDTQVFPREMSDTITPVPASKFWNLVIQKIRVALKEQNTRLIIAREVNGRKGLWISLNTQTGEPYWLLINYQPFFSDINREWIYWSLITIILSFIGSIFLALLANQPLQRISTVIKALSRGKKPPMLPENRGPRELRNLYHDINHMINDLQEIENDRQVMIAGISHDLRTPLARIRLEVELSNINAESLEAIDNDLEQINHCINQLIDYARPADPNEQTTINVSEALLQLCKSEQNYTHELNGKFTYHIENNLFANISEGNLKRIVGNLVENARKYGRTEQGEIVIDLHAYRHLSSIYIDVKDYGQGVKEEEIPRIRRLFSRGEQARTNANGFGLGLTICDRLLKQIGGNLRLLPNNGKGLLCRIEISFADDRNNQLD